MDTVCLTPQSFILCSLTAIWQPNSVTRPGNFDYQIRSDALRQTHLILIIIKFIPVGDILTRSEQLWLKNFHIYITLLTQSHQ